MVTGLLQDSYGMVVGWLLGGCGRLQDGYRMVMGGYEVATG